MERVKLNGDRYSLHREGDGAGDEGRMFESIAKAIRKYL